MKVQQLLLLALVGPFCAFTLASPTVFGTSVMETSQVPLTEGEPVIITGPPEPTPVPNLLETALPSVEATTEVISVVVTKDPEPSEAPEAPEVPSTEVPDASPTEAPSEEITTLPGETTVYDVEPAGPTQEAPAVETAAPVDPAESVEGTEESETEDVIIDEPEGSLSSGQIIGIVIGALVAVVIVVAVVIAVVRRMGKYSSAKSQKPAKKDSSLKKKSTKQQEHAKFWKF